MHIERGFTTTTTAAFGSPDEEVLPPIEIVSKPPVPLNGKGFGSRPRRDPDYRLESEALLRLTDALANRAEDILDVVCDCAMSVCEAGSAGISLIERDAHGQPDRFVWAAVRGAWAAHAGGRVPIDESPCAHVIALDDAILFEDPEIAFPGAARFEPKIDEVLLAPFHLQGKPTGAVWVLSHSPRRRFDLEDRRRLMSVARFASAAYQALQAEQALRDAQRRIRMTLNNAQIIGLWEWDVTHDVARADERCAALTGVDRELAAKGVNIAEFIDGIHPGDRARVADEIDAVARSGEAFASEYRLLTRNGETRHVLARGSCERDADGQALKFHGVVIDVTEQRRAEHASRVSAQQFRTLAQVLPNHVWTAFPDGRVDWVSDQVYAYTNVEPGTLEGRSWATAVHPDDLPLVAAAWLKSIATGQPYEAELRLRRGDGVYRWQISRATPLKGEDGEIVRWIGTNTEIEDQKAVARLLSDANMALESRVEERTRELMEAEAALRQSQKMEAVGQLTGGIAHDFNNLLTGIMGSISVIDRRLKAGRTEGIDQYTGAASAAAQRAAALTHRLLAFARRQPLDTKALNINSLTLGMQDILQRTLGEHIEMQVHLADDLWLALADANQFDNALLNLVINSRDAMPDGGKLTIETRNVQLDQAYVQATGDIEPGDYVAVTVSDTGVGMAADVLAHVFEPFYTTKPIGQGSGLGLSMIYGFIRQSGGHTRIDSEVGRGTSITLFLRRANALHDESKGASHAVVPTGHGEMVLVVEDDATVRSLMTGVLDELGYRYIDAADPREALDLLQSDAEIDLLITDVGLPYLNGRQLAEIARARRPQLRVLFVTGYAESAADRARFLSPGMELMTKPFKLDTFATTVRSLLGPG